MTNGRARAAAGAAAVLLWAGIPCLAQARGRDAEVAPLASTPLGTSFTYQGRLTVSGAPANASYDMEFSLYDALSAGSLVAGPLTKPDVAVAAGLFSVDLDFGQTPFNGNALWLLVSVRPAGFGGYTDLLPRQPLTATPYALRALNGASGAGGSGTANTIAMWTAPTTLGNSTSAPGGALLPAYLALNPAGAGGQIQFGTPNAETGMTISGASGRADVRFDGSTFKLLAGNAGSSPANGIFITKSGTVGIGTSNPVNGSLHVVTTAALPAIYGESANRGVWGKSTGASRGVVGDSNTGEGVVGTSSTNHGVSGETSGGNTVAGVSGASQGAGGVGVKGVANAGSGAIGVYGSTSSPSGKALYGSATSATGYGVYAENTAGIALGVAGNAIQNRDRGGFVKALVYVDADTTILGCYNGVLNLSSGGCGFTVTRGQNGSGNYTGAYIVDFGFQVSDRFVSVTPVFALHVSLTTSFQFFGANAVEAFVNITDVSHADSYADNPIMVIVY
jgi:hypothetical protein